MAVLSTIVRSNTATSDEHGEHKAHALVSYILLTIGLFTGVPLLIGAIWAMFNKSAAYGSVYHSHFVNATRIFWWSLFWCIIGAMLLFVGIGFVIWGIVWLWALYRVVNGLIKILSDESYPL